MGNLESCTGSVRQVRPPRSLAGDSFRLKTARFGGPLLVVALLAACSPPSDVIGVEAGVKTFLTAGTRYYAVPVVMDDGTRCVALVNTTSSKGTISCIPQ